MRVGFTNPWWVVVGAVGGLVVCNGPVLGFTFGVFLKPIMADMGWQRGTASFALSLGGVCSALTVPVLGRMMDRWSIRRVALRGLVFYAFAMCLLGLSPKSVVIFTLLFALAEAASAVQTPIGYAKAISAWFDRRRGLALGIAMSGVGLGGFIMPQLAQALIERVGWRGAYPILGLITLAIAFPLVALWIRGRSPFRAFCRNRVLPRADRRFRASQRRFRCAPGDRGNSAGVGARHRDRPDRVSGVALYGTAGVWRNLWLLFYDLRLRFQLRQVSRRLRLRSCGFL